MRPYFLQTISQALLVIFSITTIVPMGWARAPEVYDPKQVSVAVVSNPSNINDRVHVEEASELIRKALERLTAIRVVNSKTAQVLLNYHNDYVQKDGKLSDAEGYLGLAKTHWFDREYVEALATVERAIAMFEKDRSKGALLVDALLTKAMIYQETRRYDESRQVFEQVLKVDPSLTMEGLPITGSSRRVFNSTRKEALERSTGGLEIKTNPPAALVYLNGIKKGVTPLNLTALPQGNYLLTIEGSHYETINEPVVVTASTTQFIERKLQWLNGRTGHGNKRLGVPEKTERVLQDEIKRASKVGETLKVDKVILVSTEKKNGEELLVVRTVDTSLKAGFNPIAIPLAMLQQDPNRAIEKLAGDLNDQSKVNALHDPETYLDPNLGDIRVLRRKRPFYKTPVFYTLVGLVVGGAVGGTLGVLLSDDGNSSGDEGGVVIQFQ